MIKKYINFCIVCLLVSGIASNADAQELTYIKVNSSLDWSLNVRTEVGIPTFTRNSQNHFFEISNAEAVDIIIPPSAISFIVEPGDSVVIDITSDTCSVSGRRSKLVDYMVELSFLAYKYPEAFYNDEIKQRSYSDLTEQQKVVLGSFSRMLKYNYLFYDVLSPLFFNNDVKFNEPLADFDGFADIFDIHETESLGSMEAALIIRLFLPLYYTLSKQPDINENLIYGDFELFTNAINVISAFPMKEKYKNHMYDWLFDTQLDRTYGSYFQVSNKLDSLASLELFTDNESLRNRINRIENQLFNNIPFELNAVNSSGEHLKPDSYPEKLILIDFWATWCGGCISEMPAFDKKSEVYKDKVKFIQVSTDRNMDDWERFVKSKIRKKNDSFLLLPNYESELRGNYVQKYGLTVIPRYILISNDLRHIYMNFPKPSNSEFDRLLNEQISQVYGFSGD
jgi:thiol-disulfide isomerase/thioredoxin